MKHLLYASRLALCFIFWPARWAFKHPSGVLNVLTLAGLAMLAFYPRHTTAETMLNKLSYYGRHNEHGCMALNMYRERAKPPEFPTNEPDDGLIAIGWTVHTRLSIGFAQAGHAKPQSLCDVVWAANQYSWTSWSDSKKFTIAEENKPEFYRAFSLAQQVINLSPRALEVRKKLGASDHYFNRQVVIPSWSKNMDFRGTIGYHDFYVDNTRNKTKRESHERHMAQR